MAAFGNSSGYASCAWPAMYAPEESPATATRAGSSFSFGRVAAGFAAQALPLISSSDRPSRRIACFSDMGESPGSVLAMRVPARARPLQQLRTDRPVVAELESERVARAQRHHPWRTVIAGVDAQRANVVARGAIRLVGQIGALQAQRPGLVDLPDDAGVPQAVGRLRDQRRQGGLRIHHGLVGVVDARGEAAAVGQRLGVLQRQGAGELGRVGELLRVGDVYPA